MNIGELDNRARIILKGSGLSRGKTVAISISSISRSYYFTEGTSGRACGLVEIAPRYEAGSH